MKNNYFKAQRVGVVSSRNIVQILVHSHFDLEATEPVSEPVTQMAVALINKSSHFSTVKEISVKATFFFI